MSVLDADTRRTFLDKRRKTRLADAVILSTGAVRLQNIWLATKRPRRVGRSAIEATLGLAIYLSSRESGTLKR